MEAINLTPLLNAFILLLAAIIVRYLVPLIKQRTTADELQALKDAAAIAVAAAEKIYGSKKGQEKLAYAKSYLEEKGYTIDSTIETTIEAAVMELDKALQA